MINGIWWIVFDKMYLIKSISAVTNYNSSSCWYLNYKIFVVTSEYDPGNIKGQRRVNYVKNENLCKCYLINTDDCSVMRNVVNQLSHAS